MRYGKRLGASDRSSAMRDKPSVFAIDFGTSNSLLAAANRERTFPAAPIDPAATDPTVLRSALYFASANDATFGAAALRALVDNGFRGRLIRSIKRHLPSRAFTATRIAEKTLTIEQLIGRFLGVMRERAAAHFAVDVTRAVLGRPARFSNDPSEDALAEARLERAAKLAGFTEVSFCPEPVAAAYDFAADLDEPRLVLIADLGGGTSDFTLVRMHRGGFQAEDVLAVGGLSVAGDAMDGALVRSAVAPELGSTVPYRLPFGSNVLTMPGDLIDTLCSPADLTLVDRASVLRRLREMADCALVPADRGKLERFSIVVEDGIGFDLYEAVERAKCALSERSKAAITFDYPGVEFVRPVTATELAAATARALERIVTCLDETLAQAAVRAEDVEIVCLTGGTSRMPLVEAALRSHLPRAALRRLSSFHSVVHGLARHAMHLT
jgi:hypothetical chaperone protein